MKGAPSVTADVSLVLVTITLFLSVLTKDVGVSAVCFTLFIYSNMHAFEAFRTNSVLYLVVFSLYSSHFWKSRDIRNFKKIAIFSESLQPS